MDLRKDSARRWRSIISRDSDRRNDGRFDGQRSPVAGPSSATCYPELYPFARRHATRCWPSAWNISAALSLRRPDTVTAIFRRGTAADDVAEERLATVYIENDNLRAATYGEYMYGDAHVSEKRCSHINEASLGLGMIIDGKIFTANRVFGDWPFAARPSRLSAAAATAAVLSKPGLPVRLANGFSWRNLARARVDA